MKPTLPILYLFCLVFILTENLAGQNTGSLLLITDKTCDLSIDGEKSKKVEAGQPAKFDLSVGEHYVQCVSADKIERNQIATIEASKQKVLKLQFDAPAPLTGAANGNDLTKPALIQVASLNFEVPGQVMSALSAAVAEEEDESEDLPTFVFAFEEGDEVYLDCKLENEKGSINLKVMVEPEHVMIFSKRDFKKLSNEKFKVNKRGIYKFVLSTNHSWNRKGSIRIHRLPANAASVNFNTSAVKKKKYKAVTVHEPSKFYINSVSNEDFKGGKSRISIPVTLPKNTIEWYYIIAATRNENEINKTMKQFKLLGDLNKALAGLNPTSVAVNVAMNLISLPPGGDYCNVYLLDQDNSNLFRAGQKFYVFTQGCRENVSSAAVKVDCCKSGPLYIGMSNPDYMHGIHIGLEVVAIVRDEVYELD